jgi:ElaA protein
MSSASQHVPAYPGLMWHWFTVDQMEPLLLYDMLAMREAIFVVEQGCVYQELDGLDKIALHLLAVQSENVVACLRILPPSETEAGVRIGRVAVSPGWRNRGLARLMMQKAVVKAREDYPSSRVLLNAQTYLQDFYRSLGFQVSGKEFLEDGVPHVPMQMPAGASFE